MSVQTYFEAVRAELDKFKKLKREAPGKEWRRDGFTLQSGPGGTDMAYFGSYGFQDKRDEAALDFIVNAFNSDLASFCEELLAACGTIPEEKMKRFISPKHQETAEEERKRLILAPKKG